MQNVATTQSQFAALPLSAGSENQPVNHSSAEFRSFLKEAEPVYYHPVEPRQAKTDKNVGAQQVSDEQGSKDNETMQTEDKKATGSEETTNSIEHYTSEAGKSEKAEKTSIHAKPDGYKQGDLANLDKQSFQDKTIASGDSDDIQQENWMLADEEAIDWLSLVEKSQSTQTAIDKDAAIQTDSSQTDVIAIKQSVKSDIEQNLAELSAQEIASVDTKLATSKLESNPELEALVSLFLNDSKPINQRQQALVEWLDSVEQPISEQDQLLLEQGLTKLLSSIKETELNVAVSLSENESTDNKLAVSQSPANKLPDSKDVDLVQAEKAEKAEVAQDLQNKVQIEQPSQTATKQVNLDLSNHTEQVEVDLSDVELLKEVLADLMQPNQAEQANELAGINTPQALAAEIQSGEAERDPQMDQSLAALLALPNQSQQKVLTHLLDKLTQVADKSEVSKSKNSVPANLMAKLSELSDADKLSMLENINKGLVEIKAQVAQGHQPAIDLSGLISQSAVKAGVSLNQHQLNQVIATDTQTMELAAKLSAVQDNKSIQATLEKIISNTLLNHSLAASAAASTAASVTTNEAVNLTNATSGISSPQNSQTLVSNNLAETINRPASAFDKAVNITQPEGHQQLVEKVRWMVNSNNLQADIRLDPPDLGSMKVRVSLSGETASVNIVVQSQQARDVFEQSAPRLKEMLQEQGIQLGQSSVQQEQQSNQQGDELASGRGGFNDELFDESDNVIEQPILNGRLSNHPGSIDYFV